MSSLTHDLSQPDRIREIALLEDGHVSLRWSARDDPEWFELPLGGRQALELLELLREIEGVIKRGED